MEPLVSIIMPCYNAERYVAQSIESVLAQTYRNWELLITDDGSTDKSVEVVSKYCTKDDRINILVPDEHQGIARTRNMSIARARGKFVAFLDNDDLWKPEKLEKQINFMLENKVGFSYTSYELIDQDGITKNKVIHTQGIVDYNKYLRNTIIGCGTVMINRDIVGHFSMPINDTSDDMAAWLSILRKGFKAYPLDEVLQQYRVTGKSASSNKFKASRDVWRVYRKNEKLSLVKSIFCFTCYAFNAIKKRVC